MDLFQCNANQNASTIAEIVARTITYSAVGPSAIYRRLLANKLAWTRFPPFLLDLVERCPGSRPRMTKAANAIVNAAPTSAQNSATEESCATIKPDHGSDT